MICNKTNHPCGIDCYGNPILTQYEYNLRGINTEPICKIGGITKEKKENKDD